MRRTGIEIMHVGAWCKLTSCPNLLLFVCFTNIDVVLFQELYTYTEEPEFILNKEIFERDIYWQG